jgi:hypothetical protein
MGTRTRTITAAVLLAVVAAAGCGGDDDEAGRDTAEDAAEAIRGGVDDVEATGTDEAFAAPAPESAAAGDTDATADPDIQAAQAAAGRQVIREADVTLTSDDPEATVEQVTTIAETSGGFVAGGDLTRVQGILRGTVTLRVPADALSTTLAAVEEAGVEVVERSIASQDVTVEYADVAAQLRNLRALETELLALLAEARAEDGTEQVLAVFERIRGVRDEIERLQGRQQVLDDLVALATVRVTVEPTPTLLASATAEQQEPDQGWSAGVQVESAWDATVRALRVVVDVAIWLGVTAVPVLAVVGLPLLALLLAWRRLRRPGHAAASVPSTPDRG